MVKEPEFNELTEGQDTDLMFRKEECGPIYKSNDNGPEIYDEIDDAYWQYGEDPEFFPYD
jgi:hypothetical protein